MVRSEFVGSLIYCVRLVACALSLPADIHIGDTDVILHTSLTYANPRAPLLTRTCEHLYNSKPASYYWSCPYLRVHGRTAPTTTPEAARSYRHCSAEDSSLLACRPCLLVCTGGGPVFQPGSGAATDPFRLCHRCTCPRRGYGGQRPDPTSPSPMTA